MPSFLRIMPRPLGFIFLFKAQLGRGISVLPTPPNLTRGPGRDAQNLERNKRSAGEHLEGSPEEFQALQPVSLCHWGPKLCLYHMHGAWEQTRKVRAVQMPAGL